MKRILLLTLTALLSMGMQASKTLPLTGKVINPTDKHIQYVGRICFDNPMRPRFTFPGVQINARFTGTSLKISARLLKFRDGWLNFSYLCLVISMTSV